MRKSDREEFDAFVLGAWPRLFRTAYALSGNRHDAEDMLQNAFARAYANWRRVRRADSPEAYVHRIVANETVTAWRRRWRQVERSTEAPPDTASPGHAEAVSERTAIWEAIRALPPRQRAVVVLRYYEDLSEKDIAAVLGIAPGTVKSQASHAMKTLRSQLRPVPATDGEAR
ncbi:SigE family RNA polymerase sigma factor [Solicola gregarius]|uniref:SigE family RNA polymerase sigma factor n=1 Tax=Solicola gregarius TaxID=2908642 RepID=A0AA46YLL9_9ACTN|nr:SigE family RNA polymerase sigma factor [Solicola gregarius]UYM06777.1 SigE family RNA polymerase sigma factor [Solicola gregarius]